MSQMTIRDVLTADKEELPNWLSSAPQLDHEVAQKFLASRVVFYPGAGVDLHTLDVFGGAQSAHCFVHADFDSLAQPLEYDGYKIVERQQLPYATLVELFGMDIEHPLASRCEEPGTAEAIEREISWWAVYERCASPGDDTRLSYFAVLYACTEAVGLYWNLWVLRQTAPYAVLLQDHGFGRNWAKFGGPTEAGNEAALYGLAVQTNAFPRWLLVAENTTVWPGYHCATTDEVEGTRFGAMWDHPRRLFELGAQHHGSD